MTTTTELCTAQELDDAACKLQRDMEWHEQANTDHNGDWRTRKAQTQYRSMELRLERLDARLDALSNATAAVSPVIKPLAFADVLALRLTLKQTSEIHRTNKEFDAALEKARIALSELSVFL